MPTQESPELHSPELGDIVRQPVHPVARRATLLLGLAVGVLLLLAYLLRSPVLLRGSVQLGGALPPTALSAPGPFTVDRLLVRDGDTVVAGQTIAVARGPAARFEHVLYLEDLMLETRGGGPDAGLDLRIPDGLDLGELSTAAAAFRRARLAAGGDATPALTAALTDLKRALARWKREYTIVSPHAGTLRLSDEAREGALLGPAAPLATLLPPDAGRITGRTYLPAVRSSLLREGQRVTVRLHKFPYLHYGTVEGTVSALRSLPEENQLLVSFIFPRGLVTTTGQRIPYDGGLTGEAIITAGEWSLLERLVGKE